MLDIAVPAAHLKLSETASTTSAMLSSTVETVCDGYDQDSRQFPDSPETETGGGLFWNIDIVLTDTLKNVQNKAGKDNSEHEVFTQKDIWDLVDIFSKRMTLWDHGHIF